MGHRWSEEDDSALQDAVVALAEADLPKSVSLWSAVCGRLAPGIRATPDAARTRHARIRALTEAAEEAERLRGAPYAEDVLASELQDKEDAWQRVCRMVEEHEQDQLDRIEDHLEHVNALLVHELQDIGVDGDVTLTERCYRVEQRCQEIEMLIARLVKEWEG